MTGLARGGPRAYCLVMGNANTTSGKTATTWHGAHWIRDARRDAILASDGHRCTYCETPVVRRSGNQDAQLDHVRARELGGSNRAVNLVTCCRACNSAKGALGTRGWLAYLRARGVDTVEVRARIQAAIARHAALGVY